MESHRYSRSAVAALFLLAFTFSATPAGAYGRAQTVGQGVDVTFVRQQDGTARGTGGSGGGCEWHAVPYAAAGEHGHLPGEAVGERRSDADELYVVWCGASAASLAWLGPGEVVDPVQPFVEELRERIEVQPALVQARPDNRGVTGIESLFWVEGHAVEPISESRSAFGLTVTVTFQLVGVEWDFGDGSPPEAGSLGEAWPARSSVAHTYRDPSGEAPYTVAARLLFQPSYTVDGEPGAPLEPVVVTVQRPYVVREVQAVRRY